MSKAAASDGGTGAPVGAVTLVFTDVEGSTPLWESHPDDMRVALQTHDQIMRETLARHQGYEMRTEGDAFKAAFSDPAAAISWCMEVQQALHSAQWPPGLLDEDVTRDVVVDGVTVLRGRDVREFAPRALKSGIDGEMNR